jgi:hypothetical protein
LPFQPITTDNVIRAEEVLVVITGKEIGSKLRLKKKTAPGPGGITPTHLQHTEVKEALKYYYNLLIVSGFQLSEWRNNITMLIPKPAKDLRRVENYRPLTIGSLLGRIYWWILDNQLRERTSPPARRALFMKPDVSTTSKFSIKYCAMPNSATV